MFTLCKALNGQHFELASDECDLVFNPFQYIDTPEDRMWLVSFIEGILHLNNVEVNPSISKSIFEAVSNLYQLKEVDNTFIPTITDFKTQLHPYYT